MELVSLVYRLYSSLAFAARLFFLRSMTRASIMEKMQKLFKMQAEFWIWNHKKQYDE